MATQLASSNEFASLICKLQQSPNDLHLKAMVIKYLPQIRILAQNNPLAMYHLAYIYPPNSSQHKHTLLAAADMGCTNAMLAVCEILLKSNKHEDLLKAADYLKKINDSADTFIISHAKELLEKYQNLDLQSLKNNTANYDHRFFTLGSENPLDDTNWFAQETHRP